MISEKITAGGGNRMANPPRHGRPVTTVIVVYIAVQTNALFVHYASQFVSTYRQFGGGLHHRLIVCCNGGPLVPKMKAIFDPLVCEFFDRPNDEGWDVSGYQDVAKAHDCDLMVCLGESVRFHRSGWLNRIVDSATEFGEGMYGCLSSHAIRAHLNTTAFAVSPRFLKQYPAVKNKAQRYEFEHGLTAMWRQIKASGCEARLVTWDGSYGPGDWRNPDNILWRGTQENVLIKCNHTDRFNGAHADTQMRWSNRADGPYK